MNLGSRPQPIRRRCFRRASLAAAAALLLLALPAARAHQLQVEPVAVVLRPQAAFINAEFSGNVQDITQIPGVTLDTAETRGDAFTPETERRLEAYLNEHFRLAQGGRPLAGTIKILRHESGLDPTRARFKMVVRYPRTEGGGAPGTGDAITVTSTLFDYLPNALTTVTVGGFQRNLKAGEATTIDPSALASNLLRNVRDFLALGAVHIFEGIDHVLFILGLLLVSTSLRGLVKTLTGFTIAHSITLILSTLSVITPPARLVDTLVALSIVYVGLENILRNTADAKGTDHRFWVASGFGLVHGFAFATNLREAGLPEGSALFWSLLSFNVGVEIAQVTIAAAAFPLLLLWKRSTEQRQRYGGMPWTSVVRAASAAVVIAGGYWLVQGLIG